MIQSAAILGTGAVGSYLLWGLSQKEDINLCVIAKGERKERYEKEGWIINEKLYKPTIKTPAQARGVDVLFVAVKYNALEEALEDIAQIVDDHTLVLSLMNGVDSEEKIGKVMNPNQILHSLIKIASERRGRSIVFDPEPTIGIIFGELDPDRTDRTDLIGELFESTGLHYCVTPAILPDIWDKFRLNVTYNLPQAMIGCGLGAYRDSEHLKYIQTKLKEEVEAIAQAEGVDLSKTSAVYPKGSRGKDTARYSTLQDLDAKRHTEIDMFAGTLVKLGKKHGISTPYSEMTYHIIKALEEKNDGKFDY
ncbi:MAG: ketopantoate reductase family protein [Firmicutes bacterium]|nr:ketopantoate reductase family protein [Bacillota bacterium]